MPSTDNAPTRPEGGIRRRSFLKWMASIFAGLGLGFWRAAPASAACQVLEGAVCYTQNNHTCGSYCGSGLFPDDKWTKYVNGDVDPHTCNCLYVGCLSKHRCNGSKQWWMTQIGYTYCCDICS